MAETHKAYCVKDREMVEMKDPHEITMKNGRKAMQGACPKCGTKVTRIMGGSGAATADSAAGGAASSASKAKTK